MDAPPLLGIHHITAIAGDPQRNLDFYTEVLGLRLVKLTVNFDDPHTYHFYFADGAGRPGTIVTFFPWPHAVRGTVGNRHVSAIAFAVRPESIEFWQARLAAERLPVESAGMRFGEPVLRFTDPDGLPLEILGSSSASPDTGWRATGVPPEHAIGALHGATLAEEGYERTAALLTDMGWRFVGSEGNRYRYSVAASGPGAVVNVVCAPGGRSGRLGAGTVHHIAWRVAEDELQHRWRDALTRDGYNVTPVIDRTYFHSIYFREPGGILFEIATDHPGFAVDEPAEALGEALQLPPFLEPRRASIAAGLPALALPRGAVAHPS